jgi:hypothetical protein
MGKEEVLIEGGQVDVEADEVEEDVGVDLLVGVVCQKYEEPGPCRSAANFLLGEEMERDPPGRDEVVAGDDLAKNGSNKCHSLFSSIESPPAIDDEVADDILPAAEAKKVKKVPKTKKRSLGEASSVGPTENKVMEMPMINKSQTKPQQLLFVAMFPLSRAINL